MVSEKEDLIYAGRSEMARIVWKQDSQKIAAITQTGNIFDDNRRFSLVIVDLRSKNLQTVILNTEYGLEIVKWSSDDILTIKKVKVADYNGHYITTYENIYYDLKQNKFIYQTPVP